MDHVIRDGYCIYCLHSHGWIVNMNPPCVGTERPKPKPAGECVRVEKTEPAASPDKPANQLSVVHPSHLMDPLSVNLANVCLKCGKTGESVLSQTCKSTLRMPDVATNVHPSHSVERWSGVCIRCGMHRSNEKASIPCVDPNVGGTLRVVVPMTFGNVVSNTKDLPGFVTAAPSDWGHAGDWGPPVLKTMIAALRQMYDKKPHPFPWRYDRNGVYDNAGNVVCMCENEKTAYLIALAVNEFASAHVGKK